MNDHTNTKRFGRRGALGTLAALGGGLAIRALATGLPARVLLDPRNAHAQDPMQTPKTLILASSRDGDPMNANVPGTYGFPDLYHSADPAMAPTQLSLSGQSYTAAKPWADLPQGILDRTVFFHHATYTPVHGEMARVQKMMNATEKNDMLISLLAKELATPLQSVQTDPLSLGAKGGELLSAGGRVLGNVAPLSVRQALGGVDGPLKDLQALRDKHIDEIYALYKEHGTPSQLRLLDDWARSRDEARSISIDLISRLEEIDGNNEVNQAKTAAVLAAMKIAPVITMHIDFGRDNHTDSNFVTETERHLTGVATLQLLVEELDALKAAGNLQNDVVVATLNVFGRTLKKKGMDGRDHHSGHHVMAMIGNDLKGGVVGGVEMNDKGDEYISQSIDSASGAGGAGDIPFEETLAAAGKTLGAAIGVPSERLDELLPPGKIVNSVFA